MSICIGIGFIAGVAIGMGVANKIPRGGDVHGEVRRPTGQVPGRPRDTGRLADHGVELPAARDCELIGAELMACEAELRTVSISLSGTAIGWDIASDERYREGTVRRVLEDAREACPDVASSPTFIDCDEYPCMVWTEWPTDRDLLPPLLACPAWSYQPLGVSFYQRRVAGEPVDFSVIPVLDDTLGAPYGEEDLFKRLGHRQEVMEAIVLDEWFGMPE